VVRILVDHWTTLPRFAELARKDPGFRSFVLKHVDSTVSDDDLKKIKTIATTKCPRRLSTICADLAKEADAALEYDESLGIR